MVNSKNKLKLFLSENYINLSKMSREVNKPGLSTSSIYNKLSENHDSELLEDDVITIKGYLEKLLVKIEKVISEE